MKSKIELVTSTTNKKAYVNATGVSFKKDRRIRKKFPWAEKEKNRQYLLFDESNEDTLIDSIDDESGLRKAVLPISETIPDESFFC